MKSFLLSCSFVATLFVATGVCAQSRRLSAQVFDGLHNRPVEGATVINKRTNETVSTNDGGWFYLQRANATDTLLISAVGHEKRTVFASDLLTQKKLRLEDAPVQMAEMVVTGGRTNATPLVGKLDLRLRSFNNAQEVLRIVPGLFVGQHAGGGKAEQIFLRGFDVDHGTDVTLTVDGMPVNMVSHAHGQGYADLHFVIPELIENVQFQKGTYEAAKGNFATAGFVDFKTKTRLDRSSIKLEAGPFQTFRTVAQLNLLKTENRSLYAAGEYGFTSGYFDTPQNFHRLNLLTKYNARLQKTELTLTGSWFDSKWKASGQIPDRAVKSGNISFFGAIDPNEGGQTSRGNLNIQATTQFGPGVYLKNQLYYTRYAFDLFSNFTFFLADSVNGDQIRQRESRQLFGYNGSLHKTGFVGKRTLTTVAGMQLRFDRVADNELSRTKNRNTVLSQLQYGDVADNNIAVYLKESLRWNRFFSLGAALRLDHFRMQYTDQLNNNLRSIATATIASPKLNLSVNPTAVTELYLSAGKGFHGNDSRVVLDGRGRDALPAAYGFDAGTNLKLRKNLFVNAAFWRLQLEQEFVYVGDEGIVEPGGRTLRKGIDLSLRYQPFQTLHLDADFSYAKARLRDEAKGQNYIPLAPSFTSTGGLTYKTKSGWNGGLRYRFMADRPANEDYSVTADSYFLLDGQAGYANKKFELSVVAQNLLNTRWKETQFETESRLRNEAAAVSEIHFTPGTPLFAKATLAFFF